MLEALFKNFRSYNMNDLEFIIVNSKLSHSQEKLHELQKRVSFDVYQETDDEEVWSVMEGGKDDMFVYDRCGRLTYFVPFPLSILNETPLVSNALLDTYFRNPCGLTCDHNDTLEYDEIVKNLESDAQNATEMTPPDGEYLDVTEQSFFENKTIDDESPNDLLSVIEKQFDNSNYSDFLNITDYDYPLYNNTDHSNETNNNTVGEATSYFNFLYRIFFRSDKGSNSESQFQSNSTLNETVTDLSNDDQTGKRALLNQTVQLRHHHEHELNSTLLNQTEHLHHHHDHEVIQKPKKKSDRCVEADYAVCKSWSKKRLLHAQKCCSPESKTAAEVHDHKSCHNFGKKRCKKIQSILKCCIKTLYTETTETTEVAEETTVTNQAVYAVCCKITEAGKFCRMSETGVCLEGEVLQGGPDAANCTNHP